MLLKLFQAHKRKRFLVCRFEYDGGSHAGFEGLAPSKGAKAPPVAWLEPRESMLRLRRREVIAARGRKSQKLRSDPHADDVRALIRDIGVAASVTVVPRQRIVGAGHQLAA
jgi:hypothetical protein